MVPIRYKIIKKPKNEELIFAPLSWIAEMDELLFWCSSEISLEPRMYFEFRIASETQLQRCTDEETNKPPFNLTASGFFVCAPNETMAEQICMTPIENQSQN